MLCIHEIDCEIFRLFKLFFFTVIGMVEAVEGALNE
jgi:hypothetical protein